MGISLKRKIQDKINVPIIKSNSNSPANPTKKAVILALFGLVSESPIISEYRSLAKTRRTDIPVSKIPTAAKAPPIEPPGRLLPN
jgi:hypothetical protein